MTLRLLEDWCTGMDVNPRNALLVAGIPPPPHLPCGRNRGGSAGWLGALGPVQTAREDVPAEQEQECSLSRAD